MSGSGSIVLSHDSGVASAVIGTVLPVLSGFAAGLGFDPAATAAGSAAVAVAVAAIGAGGFGIGPHFGTSRPVFRAQGLQVSS
jgi:hypothetical protein